MKECLDGYRVQSSLDDDASHEHIGFTLFERTIWRPTDKKFRRAEGALRHLVASRDLVRRSDIEVILGHLIHVIGIKSTVLSTFGRYLCLHPSELCACTTVMAERAD